MAGMGFGLGLLKLGRKRVKSLRPLIPLISCLFFLHAPRGIQGYFEFCKDGAIVTIAHKDCPGGALFTAPIQSNCFYPSLDASSREHLSNACDSGSELSPGDTSIQFIDTGGDDQDKDDADSYNMGTCKTVDPTCSAGYFPLNLENSNRGDDDFGEIDYGEDTSTLTPIEVEPSAQNQTLRLFMYMTGSLRDESEGGPNFRLTDLLRLSFKIVQKHCSNSFVPVPFTQDLERAFLFLLRESDTGPIRDITSKQYREIKKVLEGCLNIPSTPGKAPFVLDGAICKTTAKVKNIIKSRKHGVKVTNETYPYSLNAQSFKWGKYDHAIDGSWGAMDFAHGLCYGTFNMDPNSHHLYQRAMERLFSTRGVRHRWKKPVRLAQEFYWDHIFRGNTKASMRNLDACIQGAYLGSPFLHRLKRPWIKEGEDEVTTPAGLDPMATIRKKRSPVSLVKSGFCFQTVEEKEDKLAELCPPPQRR